MREVIFLAGLPGSGKTTISKKIAKEFGFFHFEYDEFLVNRKKYKYLWSNDRIIMDAWYKNTDDLLSAIQQVKDLNYEKISVLKLNTPKEICLDRISSRVTRGTVDISGYINEYNFEKIKNENVEIYEI